jgi:hypothetical protein
MPLHHRADTDPANQDFFDPGCNSRNHLIWQSRLKWYCIPEPPTSPRRNIASAIASLATDGRLWTAWRLPGRTAWIQLWRLFWPNIMVPDSQTGCGSAAGGTYDSGENVLLNQLTQSKRIPFREYPLTKEMTNWSNFRKLFRAARM